MSPWRRFISLSVLSAALFLTACDDQQADAGAALAGTRAQPAPVVKVEKAPDGGPTAPPGTLRSYYMDKYPEHERAPVERTVDQVLAEYSPEEKHQAVAEILAYDHVVFHTTEWHHLDRNHAAIRRFEPKLKQLCELHEVPFLPVLAITSWENSGGSARVSYADAAGLGQMTWGAMETAYEVAEQRAAFYSKQARWKKYMAGVTGDPEELKEGHRLQAIAERLQLRERHRQMAHAAGVDDVRLMPEANLECVVVFFKFLLDSYGGRVDHAIGAYHKGVANTDDILHDYLVRLEPGIAYPSSSEDREAFLEALDRHKVTYMDLWNDRRCRQMLNGLRTVEGEVTSSANRHMALGDESDIYPWKVLGSLAAYQAGEKHATAMIEKYSGRRDVAEVETVPSYGSLEEMKKAIGTGRLVRSRVPADDLGIAAGAGAGSPAAELSYCVTPELDGYLWSVLRRLRDAAGNDSLSLPVQALSKAHVLASDTPPGAEQKLHLRGVAAVLSPQSLTPDEDHLLRGILMSDYLDDRIYLTTRDDSTALICLNPRYGDDFLASYQRQGKPAAPAVAQPALKPAPVSVKPIRPTPGPTFRPGVAEATPAPSATPPVTAETVPDGQPFFHSAGPQPAPEPSDGAEM
ncbi:MAG: hypothetical protein HY319_15575 [Armatimonadetes bacterium]|nr:hypothetical protein [Armatimonadota bacterium]